MNDIPLADAKAHLSALVDQAAHGASIRITRRGKPVAQLTPIAPPRKPIDPAALHALTATMPPQPSAREWLRAVRDDERY